jgi:hypothetical protein
MHKEKIMNNQRPVWQPFTVDLMALCNGNMDQPVGSGLHMKRRAV